MISRKLVLSAAVFCIAAAVVVAGASAGHKQATSVTTIKAVTKLPVVVVNRYIQDGAALGQGRLHVPSGGTLHIVNVAAGEGPHTFTVVAKKDEPKTALAIVNC